jgi:two-component system phosphate regulon sensor histidine kinase PhoR
MICVLAGTIVVVAAMQLGRATSSDEQFAHHLIPVLLASVLALMVTTVAATWLAYRFVNSHVSDVAHLLTSAVPQSAPKKSPFGPRDGETVLHDIAQTFSQLMDLASKDQAQLLTIISSMSDGLVATDHQQRILLTNDAARELLGFRTDQARDKQLWEVIPVEGVLKAVTEVSLTGQRKTVAVGPVNGRYLDVTICRLPLRPAGFIIVAHDVTETMRYEELRKEFVANVSHELRTPLTMIKGFVETLVDGAIDDRNRALQYLATVGRHTEQLTNLVDDLLSLSRLDSAAAVPNPRPVQLAAVASKVAELMSPAAQKKGQTLEVNVAGASKPVIGNGEYLERAISNLVENAIKYTRENGVIKLTVRDHDESGQVFVEVTDNGMGISADDLPRIFERFFRAERSRSREMGGTGLGLSIVKHIVQAHLGSIDVKSSPGAGSTFRMRFPAAESVEPARLPDAPNPAA